MLPGVTALEGVVGARGTACVYLAVGAIFPQDPSYIINAESFPDPSQYRSGSQTVRLFGWMKDLDLF